MNGHQLVVMVRQLKQELDELKLEVGNLREEIPKPDKVQTDEVMRQRGFKRNRTESP